LVDDASGVAIGAARPCRDDARGRHDQGCDARRDERPAAAAGDNCGRRRGAIEVGVSHAIIHRLAGQGAEASDEVVVVHNVKHRRMHAPRYGLGAELVNTPPCGRIPTHTRGDVGEVRIVRSNFSGATDEDTIHHARYRNARR
jgi:hypothetical protein